MNLPKNITVLFAIAALILVSIACGSSNAGTLVTPETVKEQSTDTVAKDPSQPVETEAKAEEVPQAEAKPSLEAYNVGDVIEVEDHTIRLNSVKYQGTTLVANFSVENKGSSDLSVSSMLSFSAKKSDGTKLDQEYFDCGTSGLDGSVLPGDFLRGDICWSGASPDAGIRIYYEASLFGQGAVVWNAVEGEAEELAVRSDAGTSVTTYNVGDLIEGKDHTIRLNSLSFTGNVLTADFTVENFSDSDVNMSSMMGFTAKNSDGTKLDQEFMDCGVARLDGKVLSGDRLRGSVCWKGADPANNIKIYYEENLFGEGAIVWEAVAGVAEELPVTDPQLKVDIYKAGDIVQLQDHTIVLNSAQINGDVLKANFTIQNTGSADVDVSSMLSLYVRNRAGFTLGKEYFDCGTSFDGSIIPGDKLTGDVCWSGAKSGDGLKIFYESELFSAGAVVWQVE